MCCGCQRASYWLSNSLGLSGGRFCPFWQPGAAGVYHIYSLTAWGWQGAHNGLCDSQGWQGGDFAFSASFLILNEIMPPGPVLVRQSGTSAETNVGTLPFISFKVTSMNPEPEEGLPEDPEYTQSIELPILTDNRPLALSLLSLYPPFSAPRLHIYTLQS